MQPLDDIRTDSSQKIALPLKSSCNLFTVACSVCVTDSGPTTSQGKASNSRNMSRVFSLCLVIIPLNSHATWRKHRHHIDKQWLASHCLRIFHHSRIRIKLISATCLQKYHGCRFYPSMWYTSKNLRVVDFKTAAASYEYLFKPFQTQCLTNPTKKDYIKSLLRETPWFRSWVASDRHSSSPDIFLCSSRFFFISLRHGEHL